MASQCTSAHTHRRVRTHRCCQQFPSFQTPLTPKWDRVCQLAADNPSGIHTLFHSLISKASTFFPINFLKRLFTPLNYSHLRVRLCKQQWQTLNNLKTRSALGHDRRYLSTNAFQACTHTKHTCTVRKHAHRAEEHRQSTCTQTDYLLFLLPAADWPTACESVCKQAPFPAQQLRKCQSHSLKAPLALPAW